MADPVRRRMKAMAAQPTGWDAARTEHALAGLHRRRRRRRAAMVAGAIVTLVVGFAVGAPWARSGDAPSTVAALPTAPSSAPEPSENAPQPAGAPERRDTAEATRVVRFADGSVVTPLSSVSTELVVGEVRPDRIVLQLDAGSVAVEVAPRPERRFEVACGAVRVSVLGTGFTLDRRGLQTFVHVSHGRVRVAWEEGAVELGAGEEGLFPRPPTTAEPSRNVSGEDGAPSRVPRTAFSRVAAADWQPLAERGDYAAAYAALVATDSQVEDEVETLLLAADAVRLSGHGAAALPFLERAAAHADDPRASMARFTRGRILMSVGRASEAAAELERVVELDPGGAFAEDALARAIEARGSAGDTERARELARRYLSEHPEGRWRDRAAAALGDGDGSP